MNWIIGIGLAVSIIVYIALELTVVSEKGDGFSSFLTGFKKSLLVVIPLFAAAGIIYYSFF